MTDFQRGYKDFLAWHDGVTVSDLPISDEDACRLLSLLLSKAVFTGGFFSTGKEKSEAYFGLTLPGMLTTETGDTELLLKLDIDELHHAAELATEKLPVLNLTEKESA